VLGTTVIEMWESGLTGTGLLDWGSKMKYFDVIPASVEDELIKRGVNINELLYCVKADLDAQACYSDMYIAFTNECLHIISGNEIYKDKIKNTVKKRPEISYQVLEYQYINLKDIEKMYIDRQQNTARLMVVDTTGKEYPIARLSLGFSDKFEKFSQRVNKTIKKEEIDDSLLEAVKTHCPICGEIFPNPNRPICPNCVDRVSIFKRLLGMFGDFKLEIAGIIACIFLSGVFGIIAPFFGSKMLYDDVLTQSGKYYGKIGMIIILMASISFVGTVLSAVSGLITARVTPKVTHKLRSKIFSSMQTLSLQFFTSKQTGSLMTRINGDSMNVFFFFTDIIPYAITNVVKIIGVAAIMLYLNPILTVIIIIIIAIIQINQRRFSKNQRKLYRKQNVVVRAGNAVLSDAMNGQRVVKAFAKEGQEVERYDSKNNELFSIDYLINKRISNVMPLVNSLLKAVSMLAYCVGAWLVIKGHMAFGALTAFILYIDMIYEPISFFTWIGDRWARCVDGASRMFEILDAKPTVMESENPIRIPAMKGDIELKNVSFEYEAGRPIIKDVSFKVEAGQMFGIVGKTGAGKSTIINLMARLYDVTGGEILIDGVKLKDIAIEDLRSNIGIVSQETYLFIGTIGDNIKYARPDATMEEVIEAAKSANAHEFITKLAEGYNTKVGAGGVSLSGGEKQRISIARAIIQKPNILVLDEATASMDTRTERKIQVAIDALKQGRTIISIAHRLSTLRDADMLCVIERGELKEIGTHDELIRKKGKYFELYKLQSEALKFIEA
jgi:ATP-binding cassette subfamily B protein